MTCSRPRGGSARPRAGRRRGPASRPAACPKWPPPPPPPPRAPAPPRSLGRNPALVAEVAGVAGPRDVDIDAGELRGPAPEVAEIRERFAGRRLEDGPRERPLERDRGDRLALVLDVDIQAAGVHRQPAVLRVRRGPAVLVLREAVDRAVV